MYCKMGLRWVLSLVKGENILMDEDGYICLTDFGLAKILEGNEMA